MGGLADEDRPGRCRCLQAGGGVDRVADRAVLHARAASDRAEDDRAGVDAHADAEVLDAPGGRDLGAVGRQVVRDPKGRANSTLRVVFVRGRCAEEGEDSVTCEILHRPSERLDRGDHAADGLADDELRLLRVEPLAERGGTDEVGVEGRHRLPFFTHRPAGVRELGHVRLLCRRRVGHQRGLDRRGGV